MTEGAEQAQAQRDESPPERLDRNTTELLNELRVASTGIQVMFAFLLVVPFNNGWKHTDRFEHTVYVVDLLVVALAAFLLMAPAAHHRMLFRQGQKPLLLHVANNLAIAGMACVATGFVGILVLLSNVVIGGVAPVIIGVLAALVVGGLWFGFPLSRRNAQ